MVHSITGFPMLPTLQGENNWLTHFGKRSLRSILEKKGLEPWSDEHPTANGFEEHVPSILKKLESDHVEERMFGSFLFLFQIKKKTFFQQPI